MGNRLRPAPEVHFTLMWALFGVLGGAVVGAAIAGLVGAALGILAGLVVGTTINLARARRRGDLGRRPPRWAPPV